MSFKKRDYILHCKREADSENLQTETSFRICGIQLGGDEHADRIAKVVLGEEWTFFRLATVYDPPAPPRAGMHYETHR